MLCSVRVYTNVIFIIMFPMIEYYPRCNSIEVHEIWDKSQ